MSMKNFGSTRGTVDEANNRAWAEHDHSRSWSDGGATAQILGRAQKDIEALISNETKAAIADYTNAAELVLGVSPDGQLLIGCRMWNEDQHILVKAPILQLIAKALSEMKPVIGTDPQAQAMLSALVQVGNQLANLGRAPQPPAPMRGPGRGTHQEKAIGSVPRRPARGDGITY